MSSLFKIVINQPEVFTIKNHHPSQNEISHTEQNGSSILFPDGKIIVKSKLFKLETYFNYKLRKRKYKATCTDGAR